MFLLACTTRVVSQTTLHLEMVEGAQKSAYAIQKGECAPGDVDIKGWPAPLVLACTYRHEGLDGFAYLLDIKPDRIARWIEGSCSKHATTATQQDCFRAILEYAQKNSSMMFPISGNMIENMGRGSGNYFFRNGTTVALKCSRHCEEGFIENGVNEDGEPVERVTVKEQKRRALLPDSEIHHIPSGLARLWRCLPDQFAARYPSAGVPRDPKHNGRQEWLDIARNEMLTALHSDENRLLECWMAAHPKTIGELLQKREVEVDDVPDNSP
jgi:hypothetical protein